jgi:glycosyltransferase involved in cell wall biosynthesis
MNRFILGKLREPRIWARIARERLAAPLSLNLLSVFVGIFGSFRATERIQRVKNGSQDRAGQLARSLPPISLGGMGPAHVFSAHVRASVSSARIAGEGKLGLDQSVSEVTGPAGRGSGVDQSRPLRVLYLLHTAAPGGAGRSLRYLIEHFPRGTVEATALCPPGPIAEQLRAGGVQVRPIPGVSMFLSAEGIPLRGLRRLELLRTVWHMRHGGAIRRAIAEVRPDVVHLNDRGMLHAARIARRAGVPVVMHARSVADSETPWVGRMWVALVGRYVDRVIAIDESVRRSLRGLPSVDVIYNPYPTPTGPPAREVGDSGSDEASAVVRVTYLTGLLTFKGIWDLLEAARLLQHRHDIQFLVAGGNSRPDAFHRSLGGRLAHLFGFAPDVERAVRTWVEQYRLEATVRLLGQVDRVEEVLRQSDVLVFPSHLNGPGRAVFEAGIHGIPAIVALKDRVEDVVEDGVTGIIVPPRAPGRLADAITRLADDPALRRRLGNAARSRYAVQFEPAAMAHRMLQVYRELLSHGRRSRAATPLAKAIR